MTRMTGSDSAVMCNLINTHAHTAAATAAASEITPLFPYLALLLLVLLGGGLIEACPVEQRKRHAVEGRVVRRLAVADEQIDVSFGVQGLHHLKNSVFRNSNP